MAAKCNITKYTLQKLNKLRWGFSCESPDDAILENYVESLKCETVSIAICYPDNCVNEPIILKCEGFQVDDMLSSYDDEIETFTITKTVSGGVAPYTCVWTFDPDVFAQQPSSGTCELVVSLLTSVDIETLVTQISVEVTDANGCKANKTCTLVSEELNCGEYIICPSVHDLTAEPQSSISKFWVLNWSNSFAELSPNAIALRTLVRIRFVGGTFSTLGFIPANDMLPTVNSAISTVGFVATANTVLEFKVQTICSVNGPVDNSNGIVEAIRFGCISPTITPSTTTAIAVIDTTPYVTGDITKVRFTVRKISDNTIVYQNINTTGPIFTENITGLLTSTNYYLQTELYATINGTEVKSSDAAYLNAVCGPHNFSTT